MKKILLLMMALLLVSVTVSADNSTNSTDNSTTNATLNICDHNDDGIRNLADVSLFAQCKDTFDGNNDGIHNLADVTAYAQNNQNNSWCSSVFVCEIEEINETNETDTVDFSLVIESPEVKTYDDGEIDVEIVSNETLDELSFTIGDYSESCENCSSLEDELNLSEGSYIMTAKGVLGNKEKELSISFIVNYDDESEENETDDEPGRDRNRTSNETGEPRFDLGFNKLPQAVEAGDISDEELADILRNNELNPGIINRLIKTGMLGNESLEAILDTKHKPAGIFRRLFSFLGVKQDTYAENIYENYDLPKGLEQKIVVRDDLPGKYKKEVKEKLQLKERERTKEQEVISAKVSPGQEKKSLTVGKQEARYENCEGENDDCDEEPKNLRDGSSKDKVPPGQAKNDGSGNPNKATGNVARGKNK